MNQKVFKNLYDAYMYFRPQCKSAAEVRRMVFHGEIQITEGAQHATVDEKSHSAPVKEQSPVSSIDKATAHFGGQVIEST